MRVGWNPSHTAVMLAVQDPEMKANDNDPRSFTSTDKKWVGRLLWR